jgi:hypothetical protein
MKRIAKLVLLALVGVLGAVGAGPAAHGQIQPVAARLAAADILKSDQAFKTFLASLPTVTVGEDLPRTYYLMEGDLLLDEEQVRGVLRDAAGTDVDTKPKVPGELKVMFRNNKSIIWAKGDRNLTYAVARQTFPSKAMYDTVVHNMAVAATDWVKACPTCGLTITHVLSQDNAPNIKQVTFIVAYRPNETRFIAAAFFPYDEEARRYLLIAPSYFQTQFDGAGILRHELGHVLGYRHEHIGGVVGCGTEDSNWKAVTAYDPRSVMHYYCGSGGTFDMELKPSDMAGHAETYK